MTIFARTEKAAISAQCQLASMVGEKITTVTIDPASAKLLIAQHLAKPKRRGTVKFVGVTKAVTWVRHPLVAEIRDQKHKCVGYEVSDGETWIASLDRKAVTFDEEC